MRIPGRPGAPPAPAVDAARTVRVVLSAGAAEVRLANTDGADGLVRTVAAPRVILPRGGDPLLVDGNPYRGFVRLIPTDSGVLVINELPVEQYLRGVVPLEIGARRPDEQAAVEAQAVAARSYTYARLRTSRSRNWDLRGTTADQVYGGASAERASSDAAIAATADLVITFGGQVVEAPYSASCGGETAAADEVFRSAGAAYLARVSDRLPGGAGYYCEGAPNFRWERTVSGDSLVQGVGRHLRAYVQGVPARIGAHRDVRVTSTTPSGRAAAVEIQSLRGERWAVAKNDLRFVLRSAGGAIVPSTYLSLAVERRSDGSVSRLVITGRGNGHGVGLCQWGAIGRARAGQDARTILRTYYPGTELRRVD